MTLLLFLPIKSGLKWYEAELPIGLLFLLVAVLLLRVLVPLVTAKRQEREAQRSRTLDEAEELVENGLHEKAAELLERVRSLAIEGRDPDAPLRQVRWRLAWGQCRASAGAGDEARAAFEAALREASGLADETQARLMRTRARTELAFLALGSESAADAALARAEEALREEPETADPAALGRLAWLALRLAQGEHALGRWEVARAHFERALRVALRVAPPSQETAQFGWALEKQLRRWASARAAGSFAALTLGQVLASVGDRDGSRTWLDQALAALDGPEHAITHHARAMVSLERARLQPAEALSGPARRASWLEAAVREGLACGWPNGRVLACRADLELAAQFVSLGDPVNALSHARRATEHLKDLPAGQAGPIEQEALLAFGAALAETGETDKARQTLRRVLDNARQASHPEARQHAAVAAWRLHFVLIEEGNLEEANAALVALETLVPGLAPLPRPFFAALAAHLRGMLWLHEGRLEEARTKLEAAETEARRLGGGAAVDLARSAAMGRGQVAVAGEAFAEAEEHFRRALAMPPGDEPPGKQQATRADLLLSVARAIAPQDREEEALDLVRRAFREGLASGSSAGRQVAANAALLEGDLPSGDSVARRRLYETAARLGRLSGLARGRAIADEAESRLRDLSA
jgi:tetratricopeptide (TPR) repeat protein